jgi:hypothetical protein
LSPHFQISQPHPLAQSFLSYLSVPIHCLPLYQTSGKKILCKRILKAKVIKVLARK